MIRGLLMAAGFALCATSAAAQSGPDQPLSNPQLDATRGGLMTPNGFEIGFGATVRTYVDGQLALESRLVWTDQGAQAQQTATPDGVLAQAAGLPGAGGVTQVMHNLTDGHIASVVLNTADGRSIRQETDITLAVPQLAALQSQVLAGRVTGALQAAAAAAAHTGIGP